MKEPTRMIRGTVSMSTTKSQERVFSDTTMEMSTKESGRTTIGMEKGFTLSLVAQ